MSNAIFSVPTPQNEPVLGYAPGSKERELLNAELNRQYSETLEIPLVIGGEYITTGKTTAAVCPHEHGHILANAHQAGEKEVKMAIEASQKAKKEWEAMAWTDRVAIFLRAAELITTKYRYILNASTMLNQSKNAYQAEIDAAAELADFFRFNAYYIQQIYSDQPMHNPQGMWNRVEYRALEGFVFAITPFNFTSIAGNLPAAPALMGNTVLWKPASTSLLSGWYLMRLFEEAGFPKGVINFLPGRGAQVGNPVVASEHLAGIHFTGSTLTFQSMWKTIGKNISSYRSYPRIVGETGGKDFIFVHSSADPQEVAVGAVRGSFEYQGQKCSASSRMYVPASLWGEVRSRMEGMISEIKVGDVKDYKNFMNAVIDEASFDNTMTFINRAKESADAEVIIGGGGDKTTGYFVEPTVILAKTPNYESMVEEIFAPVLTVYVYEDNKFEETLEICDKTSMYALTGGIFAYDRMAVQTAFKALRNSAGNFYINDKPTGAVVGQQPFGGARGSGTNDKAGSYLNLIRWSSPRTIKETFVPARDFRYPFMG
ncbi:L-glutamate gamma-semialdehyde dehydrogenase [bacterium]|nr:L-glutamate gamma-semialdehyde dehydrogenase [bacterium]